jgi:tetratricopeptide (TPR) repeat protein
MCGLQLLRSYTGLGRDSDAVETALTLNKLYPDDPEVLYHTARIYGNFTYQVMEKLHDEAPGSIWMLQAQGEAAESQKDYETALAAFNHVLVLEPNRPGIHYRMGRVYLTRYHENHIEKDRDAAVEQFRVELTIDPQNGNAGYELAQIDNDLGRFEQAQHEFEDVVSHHPDFEQARVGLAGILLENGKEELAAQQLRRAVELDPNDDVAWYRLTRALRTGGSAEERQKAMTEFRKVHALVIAHTAPAKAPTPDQEVTPQTLGDTGQP